MDVMILQRRTMDTLLKKIAADFPQLSFKCGPEFYWSPQEKTIYYTKDASPTAPWTLLHEVSHGVLNHQTFLSDFQLLQLELAAWVKAKELAIKYAIEIEENHIEDCLDTYRDWLHKRSLCPGCCIKSLQTSPGVYTCFNCNKEWRVSTNRLGRPYRTCTKLVTT